jgi:hypothetical protein
MAETKVWTGEGKTEGLAATSANSAGTGSDALVVVLASGGLATYSTLNPLIANHASLRMVNTTAAGSRSRSYFAFADTDAVSHLFAFRFRTDPGVATTFFQFILTGGTTGAGGLNLKSVSGQRQVVFVDSAGTEPANANFGPITYGTAKSNWYIVRLTKVKGTTTTNGQHWVQLFDYLGNLLGEYPLATNVNASTTQFVRTTWGLNAAVAGDFEVAEMKVVTDPPATMLALPTAPPTSAPTLPVPLTYSDKLIVRAAATAGAGGTVAYASSPAAEMEIAPGWFVYPRQASTGADYTVTITATESPSGMTATRVVTVPKLAASGVPVNNAAPRFPTGAHPGTTWS